MHPLNSLSNAQPHSLEMVVKIYGFSPPVFMTCRELGIDYEFISVNMKEGEHKSEHWLANMHPFGQVPVMIVSLFPFPAIRTTCLSWKRWMVESCSRMRMGSSCTRLARSLDISFGSIGQKAISFPAPKTCRSTRFSNRRCQSRRLTSLLTPSLSFTRKDTNRSYALKLVQKIKKRRLLMPWIAGHTERVQTKI